MLTAPPRDADVSLSNLSSQTRIVETDPLVLTWTVHLLRGQAKRLPWIGLYAAAAALSGLFFFHSLLLSLLPAAALLLSVSEFLFPIRYSLTQQGVQARQGPMVWEMAWRDVRHAYLAPEGIKLSPMARPNSRLEPLRGIFLRFDDNDEVVIAAVRRLREEAREDV